jgi:hypothetical protein
MEFGLIQTAWVMVSGSPNPNRMDPALFSNFTFSSLMSTTPDEQTTVAPSTKDASRILARNRSM